MKFYIIGDNTNEKGYSSHIIISSLNEAAKKMDLYSEKGICIQYDSLCQPRTKDVKVFISSYEISFPKLLIDNSQNKPLLGVSWDNLKFILSGGKPDHLAGYFPLGVDSSTWQIIPKIKDLDRFSVFVYTESLVRGGIPVCIQSFATAFAGKKDCVLKIKDRNGTDKFRQYVESASQHYDINIEYINDHWNINQIKDYVAGVDCQLYLNHSSTWALPPIELLSAGVPSVIMAYSGPKDYCMDNYNALCPDFEIKEVEEDLYNLINIGCRNFFLMDGYKNKPVWAWPNIENVAEKLLTIKDNKDNIRQRLSTNSIKIGEKFSWENSVLQLEKQLKRWF